MQVDLAYGTTGLPVELPDQATTVIEPRDEPGLTDEAAAVEGALTQPIAHPPLHEWVRPEHSVCITFTDITRATPNDRLLPRLLKHLQHVPADQIVLLNQLGTHRPNTRAELERMLTPEVVARFRVINHEPENPRALVPIGQLHDGSPALLNRHLVDADRRIITGFIEPHFFAGFSGGPKGIIPGCAGLATVMRNHDAAHLAHPQATFGVTTGNPLWEELRDIALAVGPSFLVNVTLNRARRITGVYAGDLIEAHQRGCAHVRQSAMRPVARPFDIVVTTNSGYPLDLNLYQGVKGLSAAARIVRPGGLILLACECREGIPPQSPFDCLLRKADSAPALLDLLRNLPEPAAEQWQVQILAQIVGHAEVRVYSSLAPADLRACHLEPCADIAAAVRDRCRELGPAARVAVLPQGPLTIPYLADPSGGAV